MAATEVIALVIDAMRNNELQGAGVADVGHPERPLIDDVIAIGRHSDDAGELLALDSAAQKAVDARGLLCVRGERNDHRPAHECDEVAPPHFSLLGSQDCVLSFAETYHIGGVLEGQQAMTAIGQSALGIARSG